MRILFSFLVLFIFQLNAFAFSDGYHLSKVNGKSVIKHTVEKGQTLYFISKKYNTTVNQIKQDNPNIASDAISTGQEILINFDKSLLTNVDMVDRSMCQPLIHTVEKGETLYGIAKREYGMDLNQVKSWNNMYNDELSVGQDLIVGWVYSDTSASAVFDNNSSNTYTQSSYTDTYTDNSYVAPSNSTTTTYTTPYSNETSTVTEYTGDYTSNTSTNAITTTTYSAPSSTGNTYTAPANTGTSYTAPSTSGTAYVAPSSTTTTTTTYTSPTTTTYTSPTAPSTTSNPDYMKSDTEIFIKSDNQNAIFSNPVGNAATSRPGASTIISDKPIYIDTNNSNRAGTLNSSNQSTTINSTTVNSSPNTTAMVSRPRTVATTSASVENIDSKKLARDIFYEQKMNKNGNYILQNEKGAASWFEQDNKGTELFAMHKTAPVGTVLKITNPVSKYTVYAKVVGQLPDTGENNKSLLKLSSTAVELLKAYDKMFMVECEYYLAN